jgi:hypothetical protein
MHQDVPQLKRLIISGCFPKGIEMTLQGLKIKNQVKTLNSEFKGLSCESALAETKLPPQ